MNELLWTRRSLQDLERIHSFIARDNIKVARKTILSIKKAVEQLTYYPFMGKAGRKEGTRELVVARTSFIVIYRLRKEAIEILRILHGAQKYS